MADDASALTFAAAWFAQNWQGAAAVLVPGGVGALWLQWRASRRDDARRGDEAFGNVIRALQAGLAEVRIDLGTWRDAEARCQARLSLAYEDSRVLRNAMLGHGIPVPQLPSETVAAE